MDYATTKNFLKFYSRYKVDNIKQIAHMLSITLNLPTLKTISLSQ